jgi:hypothetical protein
MKFDTLVENYITTFEEGRLAKSAKYANISINAPLLKQRLADGDFETIISSWAGHPKYGNVSDQTINGVIDKVADDVQEYEISNYDDLRSTIDSIVDGVYADKGPRRKTYTARLTSSILSLITHGEFDLVKTGAAAQREVEGEDESDDNSDVEEVVYNFVAQAEEPSRYDDVVKYITSSLSKEEDEAKYIIDSLVSKGVLHKEGDLLTAGDDEGFAKELEIEDEPKENDPITGRPHARDEDEDPFRYSPEAESNYRSTTGADQDYYDSNY